MLTLDPLLACAGTWAGPSKLFLPPDPPREAASGAVITPILGGLFVRIDYTWSFEHTPQEGTLLIGCEAQQGRFTVVWGDSWHMGDKLMVSQGQASDDTVLSVDGTYAVEGSPEWGWRTVIQADGGGALRLQMYNVSPGSEAMLGVDAAYARVDADAAYSAEPG